LAANNDSNDSCPKYRFDYVSYGFAADLCEKTISSCGPDELVSFPEAVDSFFEKFHLTDVILFRKSGKSEYNADFSGVLESIFNNRRSVRYYQGVEIAAENEKTLSSMIQKERAKADFLAVRSADENVIRAAADSTDVDVVIPILSNSPRSAAGKINHIVAKIAADKKTAFGFDIAPFFSLKGYRRSKLFADVSEMIPILRKYNVPILLFSGASAVYELRGSYELEAFGRLLGLTREETSKAIRYSFDLLQMRQKKKSGIQIMQGVEIVPNVQISPDAEISDGGQCESESDGNC
jgi:RNase P/RNase MRP subunit p30